MSSRKNDDYKLMAKISAKPRPGSLEIFTNHCSKLARLSWEVWENACCPE